MYSSLPRAALIPLQCCDISSADHRTRGWYIQCSLCLGNVWTRRLLGSVSAANTLPVQAQLQLEKSCCSNQSMVFVIRSRIAICVCAKHGGMNMHPSGLNSHLDIATVAVFPPARLRFGLGRVPLLNVRISVGQFGKSQCVSSLPGFAPSSPSMILTV
jgi:hypothetical protein